jgi:cation transport protein ChaC
MTLEQRFQADTVLQNAMADSSTDLWVFGYGSLMWRPGFDSAENLPALLHGFSRSLCIYSHVYRGTPEAPGLVLGLNSGGFCHGQAFRVAAGHKAPVLDYLREREQVSGGYVEKYLRIVIMSSILCSICR